MARRIIVALLCTAALLAVARRLSSNKPRDVFVEEGDVKIWHRTVTEYKGRGQPYLMVRLDVPPQSRIMAHYVMPGGTEERRGMLRIDDNRFSVYLPPGEKGDRVRYAVVLHRGDGSQVRLPGPGRYYAIKFKEDASTAVLAAHIACMFAAFFLMVLCLFAAIRMLRNLEGKRSTVNLARWVLAFTFIGGWPLGVLLNWQAFGVLWEGYPFGYDVTDNKTQIIFVFWLVSLLLVWGSFIGRGEERDRLGQRGFAWAIVASFIVSLALYLIPHSI